MTARSTRNTEYPPEWPGFLVTAGGFHVHAGGIVEAIGIHSIFVNGKEHRGERGFIPVRIVSGAAHGHTSSTKMLGYEGCQVGTLDVLPLTPTARQVLQAARWPEVR